MPDDSLIWLNGAAITQLPLPDRGLDFGDGLFETLLLIDAKPLYLSLHMARLDRGLQVLRFPRGVALIEKCLATACLEIAGKGWRYVSLRLTVTRGAGPRGYTPPREPEPRVVVQATRMLHDPTQMAAPAALGDSRIRLASQPALAGLKHLNRLEQVLCALDAREQGVDDALLLGQTGDVVSVGTGNVFIVRGDQISTPPLDDCGIRGTRRQQVMQCWAPALGYTVAESRILPSDIAQAEEVFYTNALYGLRPVAAYAGATWADHPVCAALFAAYMGELP